MNKNLTIVSGKGGVGKSMLTSTLATFFAEKKDIIAVDCDVDAPNLAIWLGIDNNKKSQDSRDISTVKKPVINQEKCQNCGLCVDNCAFNALREGEKMPEYIPYRCEGCALCQIVCPHDAIKMKTVYNCQLDVYQTKFGFPVIQGQIKPGEAESGEAVTEIREYAQSLAKGGELIINDAAAGIGCPVIASIVGSDYCVAVVEPSKSSMSDMKRVLEVVKHFKVPFGIVINKYDLNLELSDKIRDFAGEKFLGQISYDQAIFQQVVKLKPVYDSDLEVRGEIAEIFDVINSKID